MSQQEIKEYAAAIDSKEFPYFSVTTGELADSLWYIVRNVVTDFFKHGFINHFKKTIACQ